MECVKLKNCHAKTNLQCDCVTSAVEIIKKHFLLAQKYLLDRESEVDLLNERNRRLTKAVELLQRQNAKGQKRRKKTILGEFSPKGKNVLFEDSSSEDNINNNDDTISPADLNLALNSDELVNMSILSPSQDETIAETEKMASPRARNIWNTRRKFLEKHNEENCEPNELNESASNNASTCWISKNRVEQNSPIFVKPKEVSAANTSMERKIKLSLKSNRRQSLKQTKLKFNDLAKSKMNNNTEKDEIAASPNLYTSLKQAKQSRSMLLRTGNDSTLGSLNKPTTKQREGVKEEITFNDSDDSSSETYFELSETKCDTPKTKQLSSQKSLVPEKLPTADTSSIVILTPATQDIIFVDDSYDENSDNIGTLDLMADLMKNTDDTSLANLKRFEIKAIKQQKTANQLTKKLTQPKKPANIVPNNILVVPKNEPISQDNFDADETRLPMEEDELANLNEETRLKTDLLPRQEVKNNKHFIDEYNGDDGDEDDDDDDFVRPIIVKMEADTPTKKQIFKERYGTNCEDCEAYIKIRGAYLSDKEIEKHLRHCKHQRQGYGHDTPDGFWDPHMVSFAADDPRNEVLIDDRFTKRKS